MLVVALLGAAALASPAGGVFAGPTAASGASGYWCAAALSQLRAPHALLVEGSALYFDVSYQREAEDPAAEPEYPATGFTTLAPDLSAAFAFTTPWPSLRIVGGSFSPTAGGTRWPEDGPQRYSATRAIALTYAGAAGLAWAPTPSFALAAIAGPMYVRVELDSSYDFAGFVNAQLPAGAGLFALEDPAMEAHIGLFGDGWTTTAALSSYFTPHEALHLAASFLWARHTTLHGMTELEGPPALRDALPAYVVNPRGKLDVDYPLPWFANAEAELDLGGLRVAGLFQYARRSAQRVLRAVVYEADVGFLEGRQVSVKETRDKWYAGLRVDGDVSEAWRVGGRMDVSPRNVPTEAISPVNLDVTVVELNAGARYTLAEELSLELTYGIALGFPVEVTRSIYNPRADPTSGLFSPSARGRYDATAHKLVLGVAWAFGATSP